MGTQGHGGITKLFLGSTAEKVIRHASCPVLTVGPDVRSVWLEPAWPHFLCERFLFWIHASSDLRLVARWLSVWGFRLKRCGRSASAIRRAGWSARYISASRPGAAPALDGEQRQRIIAVACSQPPSGSGAALDGAPADRRGDQTQVGTTGRARNYPGAAGKPRPKAVAGKKFGAWGSWTKSASPAWKRCWGCMKSLCASGHRWSALTRSRWCCMTTPISRSQ